MANWLILKNAIAEAISSNGNQEITGSLLQSTLTNIIDSLGENATFAGIATPITSPGISDGPVFYIASTEGFYPNFNNVELGKGETAILYFSNTTWVKKTIVEPLEQSLGEDENKTMSQKAITENINSLNESVEKLYSATGLADYTEFSSLTDYSAGDVVLYEGVLFRFKADHAKGEWDYNEVEDWSEKKEREEKLSELGSEVEKSVIFNSLNKELQVIENKVCTWGGDFIGKISDSKNYNICLSAIPFGATHVSMEGISPTHFFFYGSCNPNENSFISQHSNHVKVKIPEGSRVVGINISKENFNGEKLSLIWGGVKDNSSLGKDVNKLKLLVNRGYDALNNELPIIGNKVFVFGGGNLGNIEDSDTYSICFCLIPSGAKTVSINSQYIENIFFYSNTDLNKDTYILHTNSKDNYKIPEGSRVLGINVFNETYDGSPIQIEWGDVYNGNKSFISINNVIAQINDANTPSYILKNHVCAWSSDYIGRIYSHLDYDVIILPLKKGESKLKITASDGSGIHQLFFFSNKPVVDEYSDEYYYISQFAVEKDVYYTIPDGACYAAVNLDAKETHSPIYFEYEKSRSENLDIIGYLTNNKCSAYILKNHVCSWGGTKIGRISENSSYDVAIIAVEEGITHVKYEGTACSHVFGYSGYPYIDRDSDSNDYNFIFQLGAGALNRGEYYKISEGTKFLAFNIIKNEGEDSNIVISFKENIDDVNFKRLAKTVVANSVGIFDAVKTQFEDVYVTLVGDSQFAALNNSKSDKLGVSAVPPTCDRTTNANRLWNAIKWGDAIYRRFDYGKGSLLEGYDNTFNDDSSAMFVENGSFKTEYIGEKLRETFPDNVGRSQITTKVNIGSFPYQFDKSEDSWWQRNIPKRFSSDANASIQFVIPKGYSKFDFIYHAHIYGDMVTITTNRPDGVVKYNSKQNDWDNAVEANGTKHDLSMAEKVYSDWGNDTYGIPNMRLHFKIEDTTVDTVVTITKSSDTTKYLIYWGVTYWGTEALPYALHISNMAVGGYSFYNAWMLVHSLIRFVPTNAIVMEIFANTVSSQPFTSKANDVKVYLGYFKEYFEQIGLPLDKVGVWLPHNRVSAYQNYPEEVKCTMGYAERISRELGFNLIANARKLCDDINTAYYPDLSGVEFMGLLGGDGTHLGNNGNDVYSAMWESLR